MAVITISRQLGSHGARIARSLAKELGYTFADKNLIDRVIRQYGLTMLNSLYDKKPTIWDLFNENSAITIEMMNRTIAALAKHGDVVILGRGGFTVLHGMSDVLNVSVKAPQDVRAERIARRDGIANAAALAKVIADDETRARFVRLFYGRDLADESQFDLVVDTGTTSDADARAQIIAALTTMKPAGDRSASRLEVDSVLSDTVNEALTWLA